VKRRIDLDDARGVDAFVRQFYAQVSRDDLLGPVFIGTAGYAGDPFAARRRIHDRQPFTSVHFERWLTLFHGTLDCDWSGTNVDRTKALVVDVARIDGQQLAGAAPTDPPRGAVHVLDGGDHADNTAH